MGDHGHVWTITKHLRWVWVHNPDQTGPVAQPAKTKELQQAWENVNGDVKWRPVPVMEK